LARTENLVHRLPYHPPLVQASGPPTPPPIPSDASSTPTHRSRSEPEWRVDGSEQSTPAGAVPTHPELVSSSVGSSAHRPPLPPIHATRAPTNSVPTSSSAVHRNRGSLSTSPPYTQSTTSLSASTMRSSNNHSPSTLQLMPARWAPDVTDPWNGQAHSFVVFSGTVPGIYGTWYVVRCRYLSTPLTDFNLGGNVVGSLVNVWAPSIAATVRVGMLLLLGSMHCVKAALKCWTQFLHNNGPCSVINQYLYKYLK
jgi:hypothetical protein